jgi:hypothetical protein
MPPSDESSSSPEVTSRPVWELIMLTHSVESVGPQKHFESWLHVFASAAMAAALQVESYIAGQ